MSKTKTRFCPSPTGLIHLGNTRTALFNYLLAVAEEGEFLLRIEDTDRERSEERFTQALMSDLRWLGLQWQEGPECEADKGPYYQSQRQAIYDNYYTVLQDKGLAYPCFCSAEQLALTRKIQRSQGKPPRYPGTCRSLSADEIAEKIAAGMQATLRFRVPEHAVVKFNDLVRGHQRFQTDDLGDFIIRRTDATAPFMYCNAIDDALMQVTHALRGEDHLTNTPRQILILEALDLPIPIYGHISLIVGPDGSPLSKRHGSRSVQELREQGYLASAVVNYLARLGHYFGHDDYQTNDELAKAFDSAALSKSPAKYNAEQLLYWQKEAVSRLDGDALLNWLGDAIISSIPDAMRQKFLDAIQPNIVFPADVTHWVDIVFHGALNPDKTSKSILQQAGPDYFLTAVEAVNQHGVDIKAITQLLKERLGVKGKKLFMPLRIAITGEQHGPELGKILQLMDVHEIKRRLESAV